MYAMRASLRAQFAHILDAGDYRDDVDGDQRDGDGDGVDDQ